MTSSTAQDPNQINKKADKNISRFFSLITLLTFFLLILAVLLVTYGWYEQQKSIGKANAEALNYLARSVASQNQSQVNNTRSFMAVLANNPSVRSSSPGVCSSFMKQQLKLQPQYTSLSVAQPNGVVSCSSADLANQVNLSDRNYFQQTIKDKEFSVGSFQIGRITNVPVLPFGYPILDDSGRTLSVLVSGLDLGWLNDSVAKLELPEGSELMVVDNNGIILASTNKPKDNVGKSAADVSVVKDNIGSNRSSVQTSIGLDGVKRLYVIQPFGSDNKSYIVLGIPSSSLIVQSATITVRTIIGLIVIAIMALAGIWIISRKKLLKPLKMSDEQVQLLKKQTENRYFRLIEDAPDPILTVDTKGVITEANKVGLELSGLNREEIVGHSFLKMTKLVTPASLLVASKHFAEMLKGKKSDSGYEITLVTKGNVKRQYDVHTTEIREGDTIVGYQVILRDVTARVLEQETLKKQKEELQRLNDAMNDREIKMIELKQENEKLRKQLKK